MHLVKLVKVWAEQEEQDFTCRLMYMYKRKRKGKMLRRSRSTDLQVWEQGNLTEKSDRIMRIDVPREAVVRNANGQVFLDFIPVLFPKCKVVSFKKGMQVK